MQLGYGPRPAPGPRCASWSGVARVALIAGRLASARRLGVAWALGMLSMVACTSLAPQPEMTPLELQALQTREFAAPYPKAFSATLSVFQDMGYIVDSADKEAGYITGRGKYSPADDEGNFWDWLAQMGQTTEESALQVTATVESITPERTQVRINLVAKVTTAEHTAAYHTTSEDTTIYSPGYTDRKTQVLAITAPEPYQIFFERLDSAIFIRQHSR